MPDLDQSAVRLGLPVEHKHQPEKGVGILTGQVMDSVVFMVEVAWAGGRKDFEPILSLREFEVAQDQSFENIVSTGRYGQIDEFRSLMTFEKLQGDLSNVMYSMRTAEIDFYAHQFVPVLKFVNSPLSRLLIADEVGLGKTIEAGLIWTECRARFKSRRLLIICPPTLVPKWIRELDNRFGIESESADAAKLYEHFERFKRRPETHSFALVTSYHALRPFKKERERLQPWLNTSDGVSRIPEDLSSWNPKLRLLHGLLEWNDREQFVDMAVFDEAHLMKNTATSNHVVGEVFSAASQSVLALTATPLTTRNRDLFSLLNLVDPDMFQEESTFNKLLKRNRPSVLLANELGRHTVDFSHCLELLVNVPDSSAKRNLVEDLSKITEGASVGADVRVELMGKASRLNELGSFMTRTRKIEVMQAKVVRDPVTLTVNPRPEELALYNGVLSLIRKHVAERGDALSLFHLIGPALSMTSCLPVMAQRLRDGSKWGDISDLEEIQSAFLEEDVDEDFVGENSSVLFSELAKISDYDFEAHDTKFEALKKNLLKRASEEKVIVFAFFKDTLAYLQRRLEAAGISCLLVTGDVKDREERDRLLTSFEEAKYRVLLCSEVAAEGVDLQFCRVMVNYDLPWNPMRVEQRIGRIDRIGQKAASIVIINFHVKGTIDGSIYQHLYQNIRLFTETVGDLEGIMGVHVNKLTLELLSNQLSPEQAEKRIEATAAAIAKERQLTAEISNEAEALLGLRSYFQESVTQAQSLGRYIKPAEIRRFTDEFFEAQYTGSDACHLNWDTPAPDCLQIQLGFRALSDFEQFLTVKAYPRPAGFRWDTRVASVVFDPSRHEELKRRYRSLTLVNHLHPFVSWMVQASKSRARTRHPAAAVRLETNLAPPATYLYLITRFSIKHPSLMREELLFRVVDVESFQPLDRDKSEALVNEILANGRSWTSTEGFPDYGEALEDLVSNCSQDGRTLDQTFHEELELRINSKRSQIVNHFERRIETAMKRLDVMRQGSDSRQKGIALTESQLTNLQGRLREELQKLDSEDAPAVNFKRIACGVVKVSPVEKP
jgi:SNF2 family DNA or RNA helicase